MPVQYTSVIDEHKTVRSSAGLFDVSHMGEIEVAGPEALEFLQYVTTNDVAKLTPGKAHYSLMLNEQGGVVDDLIVYLLEDERYLLCVNACNADKDFEWLTKQNNAGADLKNVSDDYAQIALQGPKARAIMGRVLQNPDEAAGGQLAPFTVKSFRSTERAGASELLVSATGYTGEDGVEVYCSPDSAVELWNALMEAGAMDGIAPIGLGARDTLRLEACYALHGHEIRDDLNARYSGLGWVIKKKKGDFLGKPALEKELPEKPLKLVGLEVVGRGVVRADAELFAGDEKIGWISSGTFTPTLQKAVALAYVRKDLADEGAKFEADVRGRRVEVRVVPTPFYKRSS